MKVIFRFLNNKELVTCDAQADQQTQRSGKPSAHRFERNASIAIHLDSESLLPVLSRHNIYVYA